MPLHRIACQIANYSVKHGWINDDDFAICCYAFERWLLSLLFLLTQVIIFALIGKLFEAFAYITIVIALRRRMGGIHASNEFLCLVISTTSSVSSVFIFGPLIGQLPPVAIIIGDLALILCAFFLKPSYPTQVHFNKEEIYGNIRRKNLILLVLLFLQVLSNKWLGFHFIIYSSIGLLFVSITVIIGKIYLRKGSTLHERN